MERNLMLRRIMGPLSYVEAEPFYNFMPRAADRARRVR